MFIKNPNKKETYSFRVKPKLLENIKNYAKATDQTVPEILNNMMEEITKDLHLTNDYLENKLGFNGIIGLPSLTEIYNNGDYKKFDLFSNTENRVLYELQRIPNNLDIWTDKEGYTSNKRGINHEGISFILAPELITEPKYLETPELLYCCLIPIYFEISIKKSTISVTNISLYNAYNKINKTSNIELLDDFCKFTDNVSGLIEKYSKAYNRIPKTDSKLLHDLFINLRMELSEYSNNVNIDFLSHDNAFNKRQSQKPENNILTSDNPYLLNAEIVKLKNELEKTTKENEDLKEDIKNLMEDMKSIKKLLDK